jgi:hypothetical protein
MKKLILPLLILIVATSCTSIKVSSDFDKTVTFAAYKTYAFTPEAQSLKIDDLNRNRLLTAISNELSTKGFTKSENPDVWIDIKIKLKEQQTATATTNSPYGYGYGYGYRYGGGFTTTTINYDTYVDGTIFVDMIDVAKKQLVWQGRGTGTLDPDASQQKREKNINYSVKQIFTKYPPVLK